MADEKSLNRNAGGMDNRKTRLKNQSQNSIFLAEAGEKIHFRKNSERKTDTIAPVYHG
jgi:hypothetical protein